MFEGFFLILSAAGWYAALLLWTRLMVALREIERRREACRHHCPLSVCPDEVDRIAGDLEGAQAPGRAVETGDPAQNSGALQRKAVPARSA